MIASDTAQRALKVLRQSPPVYSVATVTPDGCPHVVPVYGKAEDDFAIRFASPRDTQKVKNIKAHSQTAFVVWDEGLQIAVRGSGRAHQVSDPGVMAEFIDWLQNLQAQHGPLWLPPTVLVDKGGLVVFEIKVAEAVLAEYDKSSGGQFTPIPLREKV